MSFTQDIKATNIAVLGEILQRYECDMTDLHGVHFLLISEPVLESALEDANSDFIRKMYVLQQV